MTRGLEADDEEELPIESGGGDGDGVIERRNNTGDGESSWIGNREEGVFGDGGP